MSNQSSDRSSSATRQPSDEFYVGYQESAPPILSRFLRTTSLFLLFLVPVLVTILVSAQSRFAEASFEFGDVRQFEGTVAASPPMLLLDRPETESSDRQILVDAGKKGADEAINGLSGERVTLEGQRIYRDGQGMLELVGEPKPVSGTGARTKAGTAEVARAVGRHRLVGEIVDTKCHLGVMKPGNGKPHRACAARCISGGIPAALWVRDRAGVSRYYLLEGPEGGSLSRELLDSVGEPVAITGRVFADGTVWRLRTTPGDVELLGR